MMERVDTVVIGGGQAGLAMSWHLAQRGREHVVLERGRVAERWRTQRWDSLMFQFPNWSIELPGRSYSGSEPEAFSPKDAIVDFIGDYATEMRAPIRTGVNVVALRSSPRENHHRVITDSGEIESRNVVVATGPYQKPRVPASSSQFPAHVVQLHAGEYRNPSALPDGSVLVVGSGASGCQIAEELAEAGRQVFFSVGRHRRVPRRYRGRDVFWWRRALGQLDQVDDGSASFRRLTAPLVTGVQGGRDIDIRTYATKGMTLVGRILGARDGRVALDDDLERNLAMGDRTFDDFIGAVDRHVRETGSDVSVESTEVTRSRAVPSPDARREIDLRASAIGSVIWATGYELDFGWIELPAFDELGRPVHRRGVSPLPGLHFLGLAWLHKPKSSFLYGVGEDAAYLADHIARR